MEQIKVNTIMGFQEKLVESIMNNLLHGIEGKDIVQLRNKLKEEIDFDTTPAIIVSAGPSLDKNVHLLMEAKNKAFILSTDAALRTLGMHGIKPDAAYTLDASAPLQFLEGVDIDKIPLFITQFSSKEIVSKHQGIKILVASPTNVHRSFFVQKKGYPMPVLEISGSVGSDAMPLLRYLGFKTIIYIGQDLAYLPEKTHTDGFIVQKTIDGMRRAQKIIVEGIDGNNVETGLQFDLYRRWMEARLKNNTEYQVIDATEGGALIHGTKVMTFRQAIDRYCHGDTDFEVILQELPATFNKQEQEEFKEDIKSREKDIQTLKARVDYALQIYPKLIVLAEQGQEGTQEFARLYNCVRDISGIDQDSVFSAELKIYNRKNNYENTEAILDKNTTVTELLQHTLNILEGYKDAIGQLQKDYKEKVIDCL